MEVVLDTEIDKELDNEVKTHTFHVFQPLVCLVCAHFERHPLFTVSQPTTKSAFSPHSPNLTHTSGTSRTSPTYILSFSQFLPQRIWPSLTTCYTSNHHFPPLLGPHRSCFIPPSLWTSKFWPWCTAHTQCLWKHHERYIERWFWPGLVTVVYISLILTLVQQEQIVLERSARLNLDPGRGD